MKTQVAETSIRQYRAMKGRGFNGQHESILSAMLKGQIYSRRQIARMTGLETSTTSARVNKLIELGEIEVCGRIDCPITGVNVEAVRLASVQPELFN